MANNIHLKKKKIFFNFLKEKGIYEKWKHYYLKEHKQFASYHFNLMLEHNHIANIIMLSFDWGKTIEGAVYWCEKSDEWENYWYNKY